ncbi:hypothetical protein BD309DRAFT_604781 [Dichomitus squalens]|uniref:CCR4-Not complex component Not1 C-terminal domain-containing protein n=1 Tax=Dichomitus squalens TaxID=114155 RepID=A0A4Q9Q142_9APHY|nr:hypothetical protein BD309DRAFT_604781 [Dichomitus squalens]TBU60883.1 hypothetical protein BD310DRAFT_273354 [Dichomitus squalens]
MRETRRDALTTSELKPAVVHRVHVCIARTSCLLLTRPSRTPWIWHRPSCKFPVSPQVALLPQVTYFPGFAFSWMSLISHRLFMPKLLLSEWYKPLLSLFKIFARLLWYDSAYLVLTAGRPQLCGAHESSLHGRDRNRLHPRRTKCARRGSYGIHLRLVRAGLHRVFFRAHTNEYSYITSSIQWRACYGYRPLADEPERGRR